MTDSGGEGGGIGNCICGSYTYGHACIHLYIATHMYMYICVHQDGVSTWATKTQ